MKTILLVDDEYAFVENVTELLQLEGYRVVCAGNGEEGLDRFRAETPDLVVTDFMMPIADGRDLIRWIRALPGGPAVPIVVVSATTRAVALSPAGEPLGVAAFLPKPVRWEKLLAAVREQIGPGEVAPRHERG